MRAVAMCEAPMIFEDYLPLDDLEEPSERGADEVDDSDDMDLKHVLEETEKNTIMRAISRCRGNSAEAIRMLGISKSAFYEKLKKYGL